MSEASEKSSKPAGDAEVPRGRIERIERDPAGRLVARVEGRGEPVVDVRVARCFPWTLPHEYISVRTKEGKEIQLLRGLGELDEASQRVVEKELHDRVFNPQIRRVLEYKQEFGVTAFHVETDRGEVTFQIRSRDDVRALSPTRALFRDVDGNTYEIPDITALDAASQKHLEEYF